MTSKNINAADAIASARPMLTTQQVVARVREMIQRGELRPGDQLPAERDLAGRLGISRPSLRAGLRSLAAMGILRSRHGAGTFVTDGPPTLDSEPLSMLAALHGFSRHEMFEARRTLEVSVASLAAGRATGDHLAAMAEEVAGMYASLDDPQQYLIHDMRFHRAIAFASGNQILATLVEMVSAALYAGRRKTVERARDFKESAAMHRKIYLSIRARKPEDARAAMHEHLVLAQQAQESETADAVRDKATRRTTVRPTSSRKGREISVTAVGRTPTKLGKRKRCAKAVA